MNITLTNSRTPLSLHRSKFMLVVALLAASIELAHSSETPTLIDRPSAGSGPTKISVLIWVLDINSIDSAQQSFTADVGVILRWKDSRLAHTGSGVAHYALEQIGIHGSSS